MYKWKCNLCGKRNHKKWIELEREGSSCELCGSSVRERQIVWLLRKNGYRNRILNHCRIIGLSDSPRISEFLSKKFSTGYQNTFFDFPPFLDITNPDPTFIGKANVLISSDVLEHVFYPVSNALKGSFDLLVPGGRLIMTVPYTYAGENLEHFPWMVSYETVLLDTGDWVVNAKTIDGNIVVVENPIFHGGPGNTLEMRLMSREAVFASIVEAGFVDIDFNEVHVPKYGIRMQLGVISASRPK